MLERLSGRTHEVISGLCLVTRAWEEVHHEVTEVTFRALTARDLAHYVGSREWEGRAGGYAIQGLGRRPRRADRGRLPERRRASRRSARPPHGPTVPRRVRIRLIQPGPGDCPPGTFLLEPAQSVTYESLVRCPCGFPRPPEECEHRPCREELRALAAEHFAVARPSPVARVRAKACADRVQGEVTRELEQVCVALDRLLSGNGPRRDAP